jgi:hypothetical protein
MLSMPPERVTRLAFFRPSIGGFVIFDVNARQMREAAVA